MRVFKSEKEGSWPYFLFYVEGSAASGNGEMAEADSAMRKTRVVKRSEDGKHVIREHVIRAKL
jgi:hypothetical protein